MIDKDTLMKKFRMVDRSRTHHLPKVTEKALLGLSDAKVLYEMSKNDFGITEAELSLRTNSSLSAVSKSIKRLLHHKIIYFKATTPKHIFSIRPIRKLEVKLWVGLYQSGKTFDVFDSHFQLYSIDLPKAEQPRKLRKKLTKKFRKKGWTEAAHPEYSEWGFPDPFGTLIFRFTNAGHITITIRLETLAFHPLLVEELNLNKLYFYAEYLRINYGIHVRRFNLEFKCSYTEIPFLLDPFAVNAIKLGLKARYKEVEESHFPEWEEKGIDAIAYMDSVYSLRQFCKNNHITEYELSKLFSDNPELKDKLARGVNDG